MLTFCLQPTRHLVSGDAVQRADVLERRLRFLEVRCERFQVDSRRRRWRRTTIRSNAIPHSLGAQWKGKHFASRPPSWRTLLRRTQQVAPSEHVHAPSARASWLHRVSSQRRRPVCNPQLRPTAPEQRWINLHRVPARAESASTQASTS